MPGLIDTTTGLAEGTTGLIWLSGGLGGDGLGANLFSPQASQFLSRLATQPTSARQALYAACIDALVAGGVWTKLDALYLLAAANAPTALTNLRSSSFSATATNNPTFTANQGYAGDGATSLVDTNFNPTTASAPFYVQDSAHISAWVRTSRAGAAMSDMGNASGTTGTNIIPFFTDNSAYLRVNDNAEAEGFAVAASNGYWLGNRSSSTARQGYLNAVSVGTYLSNTSKTPINSNMVLGHGGGSGFSTDQISAASIGGSLTSGQVTTLYNALNTYLTAVGGT